MSTTFSTSVQVVRVAQLFLEYWERDKGQAPLAAIVNGVSAEDDKICANRLMEEAFGEVMGEALDVSDSVHQQIWDASWQKLRDAPFLQDVVRTKHELEKERLLIQTMGQLFCHDEGTLRDRTGEILLVRSDDPSHQQALCRVGPGAMASYHAGTTPDSNLTTVLFKDRIPPGVEERVILREMFQIHARRVDTTGRLLLEEAVGRWDTWGASKDVSSEEASQAREIFQAVKKRIEPLLKARSMPSSLMQTQFVFAVQEAVKRGVEPDVNGRGVSGWLHEVIEHVRYSIKHTMGLDLKELSPENLVEMTRFDNPFRAEVKKMYADESARAQLFIERSNSQSVAQRYFQLEPPEMTEGEMGWPVSKTVLGYYESGDPVLVVFECPDDDSPDDVRIRTVDSEGWDVTGRIVAWVDVPVRPSPVAGLGQGGPSP